jgi:hypothetical protein
MKIPGFHRHSWCEVHREFLFEPPGSYLVGLDWKAPRSPVTVASFHCTKCHKIKQQKLAGHVPQSEGSET